MSPKSIKHHAHNFLKTLNPKSQTRIQYGFVINNFFKFLGQKHINLLHIEQFLASPATKKNKRASNAYFNIRLATLRSFFTYLEKHNIINKNPTRFIKSQPTPNTQSHRSLTMPELKHILRRTTGDAQHAIFILANTGLRISELANIRRSHIKPTHLNHKKTYALQVTCKGQKLRRIELNNDTLHIINKRFEKYKHLANTPLFPASIERGQCIKPGSLYNKIKKQLKTIGYPHVTPHWLRHTFAQQLHQQKIDSTTIQQSLGHNNLNTTQRYLQKMAIVPTQINLNIKI